MAKTALMNKLRPFLLEMNFKYQLKEKVKKYSQTIEYVQIRVREQQTKHCGKVEQLIIDWENLLRKIKPTAIIKHDPMGMDMIAKIEAIPEPVRFAVLLEYLRACRRVHFLAFG